jgi:hypothetical protein
MGLNFWTNCVQTMLETTIVITYGVVVDQLLGPTHVNIVK